MQVNGTAKPSLFNPAAGPAVTLDVEIELSADEMAAALWLSESAYHDLETDESVRQMVVYGLMLKGLPAVQELAVVLDCLPVPAYVAFCRRRVSEVYGQRALALAGAAR